jgi:hypothetical protein
MIWERGASAPFLFCLCYFEAEYISHGNDKVSVTIEKGKSIKHIGVINKLITH